MNNQTTEFYMTEIHRLTQAVRRLESNVRILKSEARDYESLRQEHLKLWVYFDELESRATAEHVERLEEENKQLRAVIQEQQFYVAQRKACKSCEEHVDYAPNLQDMAKHFAGLLGEEVGDE